MSLAVQVTMREVLPMRRETIERATPAKFCPIMKQSRLADIAVSPL
jgi:hypothetical protein